MLVDSSAIRVGSAYSAAKPGEQERVPVTLVGFDKNGACIVEDMQTKEQFTTRQLHYIATIGHDQD